MSEQFEESQGLYNQQMHVNVQRNLREGVWVRGWVSKSENGGEIQMSENLLSDGVILTVSESDSQVNESETQERVSESASEVRVNQHDSHLNESEIQERVSESASKDEHDSHSNESETQERLSESASEVKVNEHDIQVSEVTTSESEIHERVQEKSGVTEIQVSTEVTL